MFQYYRCVHNQAVEFTCKPETAWNSALNICDWPINSLRPECQGKRSENIEATETPEKLMVAEDKPTEEAKPMEEPVKPAPEVMKNEEMVKKTEDAVVVSAE